MSTVAQSLTKLSDFTVIGKMNVGGWILPRAFPACSKVGVKIKSYHGML